MDLRELGAVWLAGQLKASSSVTVQYNRGTLSVPWQATLGESLLQTSDGQGNARTERTDRDFVGTAQDLVNQGIAMPPATGDTIDVAFGSSTCRYALLPYNRTTPPYRYEDPFQIMLRVHGKYQGTV